MIVMMMDLIDGWNIHGSYASTGDYSSQPRYIQLCEGYTVTDAGLEKKTASLLSAARKEANMNEFCMNAVNMNDIV